MPMTAGLYTNLITAGVLLDEKRVIARSSRPASTMSSSASRTANPAAATASAASRAATPRRLEVARLIRAAGLPLTLNLVVHRQNLHHLEDLIDMALDLDAHRIEIAHVQYYGWALPQPRRADADARAARGRHRDRDGGARAPEGQGRHRLCRARLLCPAAEVLHGRLGSAVPQHLAGGQGPALPRRGDDHDSQLRFRAAAAAGRYLAELGGVRALSRHRLDAGALPLLRPARDRLGRLPLSGLRDHRRCRRGRIRPAGCRRPIKSSWALPRRNPRRRPTYSSIAGSAVPMPSRSGSRCPSLRFSGSGADLDVVAGCGADGHASGVRHALEGQHRGLERPIAIGIHPQVHIGAGIDERGTSRACCGGNAQAVEQAVEIDIVLCTCSASVVEVCDDIASVQRRGVEQAVVAVVDS